MCNALTTTWMASGQWQERRGRAKTPLERRSNDERCFASSIDACVRWNPILFHQHPQRWSNGVCSKRPMVPPRSASSNFMGASRIHNLRCRWPLPPCMVQESTLRKSSESPKSYLESMLSKRVGPSGGRSRRRCSVVSKQGVANTESFVRGRRARSGGTQVH